MLALLASAAMAAASGCDLGLDQHATIRNESDASIWLASRTSLGEPPDDELRWVEVQEGETLPYLSRSRCFSSGIVLVATEPDADAVVDRRNLEDDPWCANGPWPWGRPGQRE